MGTKDKVFYPQNVIICNGKEVNLDVPKIMGILNVTPDSFYAESRTLQTNALKCCEKMLDQGATFIDVGGQSTRPGAISIGVDEEIRRTLPIIKLLVKNFPEALISIDTYRSAVAKAAIESGVAMINDVSGGQLDQGMFDLVAQHNVSYVLTHMQGAPENMQKNPTYSHVTKEIFASLSARVKDLQNKGANQILIDPGFGLGKTVKQNYALLDGLHDFMELKLPILVGISRKSMIYKQLKTTPEKALNGTSVINTMALERGAQILRVHDVKEAVECITLWSACSSWDD
ncbi:MAG: dihydropteroate synthase [Crocinitomicaceae bacterium]|jgi:dihydropteroate synthase|nr:dihydropteroate synthase [Crocinitomicaceae bacterium]